MTDPTVAIALGAGGVRGLAHVHALGALDDLGVKPVAIAGTSIGALMGAAYASGMSGAEIQAYADERFRDRFQLLARLWKLRPDSVRQFIADGGPRLGEIVIERVFDLFLPPEIADDFSDLQIPLQVVATDYYAHRDRVFRSGPLRPTLAASAAMPAVFRPVVIEGDVFIDGGITNPVPFDLLVGMADIVVGIDVTGNPRGIPGKRPNKVDVLYASSQLMQQSITRGKTERHPVDILLPADVSAFRVLDFLKTRTVLETTAPLRDDLKKALSKAIEARSK